MAMNDPKWGRGDGPPDLDEIWKRFTREFSLFGKKGGNGSSGGSPKNLSSAGGGIVLLVAVLIWAASVSVWKVPGDDYARPALAYPVAS